MCEQECLSISWELSLALAVTVLTPPTTTLDGSFAFVLLS